MNIDTPCTLLGGLSPSQFMRRHWQKRPLFVRAGLPGFTAPLSLQALRRLARDANVESRLVRVPQPPRTCWSLQHGPFNRLPAATAPPWSLLVQGVNFVDPGTDAFLDHFRFIPSARLDDVMVSLANRGGGVGAHYDSYDVFLIQAAGTRRWRIGHQTDLSLVPGAPLKLLADFKPEATFEVTPGDILYLPPEWAHEGVATSDDCMTLSVGFRSPAGAELARAYADFIVDRLAERRQPLRPYRDRGLAATRTAAEVPHTLQVHMEHSAHACAAAFHALASQPGSWQTFLGEWLTEPRSHLFFEPGPGLGEWPPARPLTSYRLRLDSRSLCVRFGSRLFINAERWPGRASPALMALADRRQIQIRSDTLGRLCWRRWVNSSDDPAADAATQAPAADRTWRALTSADLDTLQSWLEDGWIHLDVLSAPHINLTQC